MMTIHKLTAGDGYTYLTRHVAGGDVDRRRGQDAAGYYTAGGNPRGGWLGKGIAALGLSPGDPVTEAQMKALFGLGLHPGAEAMIAEYQATHVRAGMSEDELMAVAAAARKHASLGRQMPVYKALDPDEQRVERRLANIAAEMQRPATSAEEKKIRREEATRQRAAVAGYDVVFAPVKSAALLWALDERDWVRAAVRQAHEEAKNSAIAMLEQHAAYTRTGRGGIAQIETEGLVAVAFDHYDSRCGDPNLHTHVVLANKIQGVDGKWRTLDASVLYEMTVAASEHYNTAFETALTTRLGVRFAPRPGSSSKEPVREIDGIPTSWISLFSRRRTALENRYDELLRDYRREHGRDPSRAVAHKLARQANLDTRDGKKPPRALAAMRADWREQITQTHGADAQQVLNGMITQPDGGRITALPDTVIGELADGVIRAVAEQKATWTRWNVHAQTERALRAGDFHFQSVEDLKRAAEVITERAVSPAHSILIDAPAMVNVPAVLRRSDGESVFTRHGGARYTSQLILAAEQRLVQAATVPAMQSLPRSSVISSLEGFERAYGRLDPGQRQLVTAFACADTRIAAGIGAAGTGKTTAMKAFSAVAAADGRRLIPLATSAASASVLAADLGIAAENLHKFLYEHQHGAEAGALASGAPISPARRAFRVVPGDVILVDEAGMAGTLALDGLAAIAVRHGASVRLLGDWRQLGAVESGGALRLIAAEAGAAELDTLHRFTDPAEAAATLRLRTGDSAALDFYQTHRRIIGGSRQAMIDAVYEAWKADMLTGRITLMIASTNRDISALSARARAERVAARQVEQPGMALRDGNLAGCGDWIVTRDNNRRLTTFRGKDFVKNGDAWTVLKRHHDGSLRVRHQEHGGTVTLPAEYVAQHVALHYATTTHRAQGCTVDTAHLLIDDRLARENLYVALTRARLASFAYVATHELLPLDEDHRMDRPRHDPDARAAREVLEQILSREGAQLSATETIRETQQQAASLATLVPQYLHAAEQAATTGYQTLIRTFFPSATADLLIGDAAFSAIVRSLRYGKAAGWQPEQLLAVAARRGPLSASDSPAQLLAWRCKTTVDEHPLPAQLIQPTPADAARYTQLIATLTGLHHGALDTQTALALPAALTMDPALAGARRPDHYQAIIVGVLGPATTLHAAGEPAWPALTAAIRRAEHAGHHPAHVLARVYAQRELDSAESVSEVLAWRIGRHLDRHPTGGEQTISQTWNRLAWTLKASEEHHGTTAEDMLGAVTGPTNLADLLRHTEAHSRQAEHVRGRDAELPPWLSAASTNGSPYASFLHASTEQITARVRELTLDAADRRPAWTTVFGIPPNDPTAHDQWLGQLGIAAAYRDQHQVAGDDPAQPLGPYVEPGRAGHHAYWKAAQAVIAGHQLAHPTVAGVVPEPGVYRIAVDVFTALPEQERSTISEIMAARLGSLWLGLNTDTDTAATQPAYATELAAILCDLGLLSTETHIAARATPSVDTSTTARDAERLATLEGRTQTQHEERSNSSLAGPELLPPSYPEAHSPQIRW